MPSLHNMTNALLLGILICRAIFIICQTYLTYCTFFWSTRPPLWLWHSLCSFYSLKRYLTSLLLNNIIFVFNVCHISILFIYDSDPSAIGHGHPTQAASSQIDHPFLFLWSSKGFSHGSVSALHAMDAWTSWECGAWGNQTWTLPLMCPVSNCCTINQSLNHNDFLHHSPSAGSWHHSYVSSSGTVPPPDALGPRPKWQVKPSIRVISGPDWAK